MTLCGFHGHFHGSGGSVVYAALPEGFCNSGLPTGNPWVDPEISPIAHELFEAATDPLGSAWDGFRRPARGNR
jgi:hypothetical protein